MVISRLLVSGFKNSNQHNNYERIQMTKKKWDALPIMTYKFTMYKEDAAGNQKFYDYNGDHSSFTDGIYNEDLNEIEKEDA